MKMRSAKRKAKIEGIKKKGLFYGLIFKLVLPVLLVLAVVLSIKLSTRYWNGSDKFAVSFKLENGDVAVTVIDPKLSDVTTLVIPGDTQVDVARNYGTMRIKNVWQLGANEKIGGGLLAQTITQNFLFPVFLWDETSAKSLGNGNVTGILTFIFIPGKNNIPFGDRLLSGLFAMKIQSIGRDEINLGKSQFLAKQKLNDGVVGYVLSGPPSQRLTTYFSDNYLAEKTLRVGIEDATGVPGVADGVGQIIEVMGGKIVAVDKQAVASIDCLVSGADIKVVKKIANLFSCKIGKGTGTYDLDVSLGSAFVKRF